MQHRRVRTIFSQVVGGAIVKAHADGKDKIGVVHRHIGFVGAVHAEHAHRLPMGAGESAQPHQRTGDRNVQLLRKLQQLCLAR